MAMKLMIKELIMKKLEKGRRYVTCPMMEKIT